MKDRVIYLDSHASTRVDQDVLSYMMPYFTTHYANGNHREGMKAMLAIENSRLQVSSLIGACPSELIFTSGATEAINMGLLGLAKADRSGKKQIITQPTEHAAVQECTKYLETQGYSITQLGVDEVGRINIDELKQVVNEDTLVVAIMLANNEIGTVQPVEEIGKICRDTGTKFFCDLTQGLGWYPINVDKLNIDLASISSHKIYGPKGAGALFVRKRDHKTTIDPIHFGGKQEQGLRPGTSNVPAIAGFGKACELLEHNAKSTFCRIREMRDNLQAQLFADIEEIRLNGCLENRHPANLNVSIPHIIGEQLKEKLPNIMFSTGSACNSGSAQPSRVLSALSLSADQLSSAIRIGISKYNTPEEIEYAGRRIVEIAKLR